MFFEDYEKSKNSFETGDFFPDEALKKLSSYIGLMSFNSKLKISQWRLGCQIFQVFCNETYIFEDYTDNFNPLETGSFSHEQALKKLQSYIDAI